MIIALSGKMGAGKDYACRMIKDLLEDEKVERVAFADPIKEMAAYQFGWDGKKDKKGRKFLQLLGTEIGRCYIDDLWLKKGEAKIGSYPKNTVIVVTDLRFEHEAEMLRKMGACIVEIKKVKTAREALIQWFKGLLAHSSEKGVSSDLTWINDHTKPSLLAGQIRMFLEEQGYDCGELEITE